LPKLVKELVRETSEMEAEWKLDEHDWGDIKDAFPTYMQPEKVQYLGSRD
jgi:hypothetical protein